MMPSDVDDAAEAFMVETGTDPDDPRFDALFEAWETEGLIAAAEEAAERAEWEERMDARCGR